MNGALVYDYLRSGNLADPVGFAVDYYRRLPAISIPYHPPLFPVIEALCYALFGVSLLSARLAVAAAVFLTGVLLFRLVKATHGSGILAGTVTIVFLALPMSRTLGSDVMVEFPALAFLLAALCCLRELPGRFTMRQGLLYALLAGAAVWTKQQTVFVGLVPFLFVGIARQWRRLQEPAIWTASALLGLVVILLTRLPAPATFAGFANELPIHEAWETVWHHVPFYGQSLGYQFGWPAMLFIGASAVVFLVRQLNADAAPGDTLYLAWLLGLTLFVLFIGKYDERYFFFAYPTLVVIGMLGLSRLTGWVLEVKWQWVMPGAVTVVVLVAYLRAPASSMSGPAQAAEFVVQRSAGRVMYCGKADGAFVFAMRTCAAGDRSEVLRGEKLPAHLFLPCEFEAFAVRHGIDYVIFEYRDQPCPWAELWQAPPARLVAEVEMPIHAYPYGLFNGRLRVCRVIQPPAPTPAVPVEQTPTIGAGLHPGANNDLIKPGAHRFGWRAHELTDFWSPEYA